MKDNAFERLQQIAKDEFGLSIVKTDHSKTSQILLDELKSELVSAEKLNRIKALISEKNGVSDSQEFGLSYSQAINYLEEIEDIIKL